jgi:hypothetical protein
MIVMDMLAMRASCSLQRSWSSGLMLHWYTT